MGMSEYFGIGDYHGLPYAHGNFGAICPPKSQREIWSERFRHIEDYCKPDTPYYLRDKRYYAAKYYVIFRNAARKEDEEYTRKYHRYSPIAAKLGLIRLKYRIMFENTFDD